MQGFGIQTKNIDELIKKIEVKENVDKLYENYPEYFTEYKLTFKDNKDGSYTFVSNEPITK